MAIDVEHHRLFLGCDNKKMVMMNSATGKALASVTIGAGVDANAFDPGTQLAFSSNGEDGNTTIAKESGDKLTMVQQLLNRQAEWQKGRQSLTWSEKIRIAERVLESARQWRLRRGPEVQRPSRSLPTETDQK